MKKTLFNPIFVLLFVIGSFCCTKLAIAEEVYHPYPVVFVHGFNSSDGMWIGTKDELREKYFKNGKTNQGIEEFKYPNHISENNYFLGCDYAARNNGDISDIAREDLKKTIDDTIAIIKNYTPESEQKVVIVCHSMGGLVVRSLLKQFPYYKDKIHRVVFIDTPHLGSPYASAVWLLNEIQRDFAENKYKNVIYHSYSAFSPFTVITGNVEYPFIYHAICNDQEYIDRVLFLVRGGGILPEGMAIRQLRIPDFTYYEKKYSGLFSSLTTTIYKSYSKADTFLGQSNLDVPQDPKVIIGKNTLGWEVGLWAVSTLHNLKDDFKFPVLAGETQTMENAIFIGDGIVTKSSQEGIGAADYAVDGFHVGIADNCITEVLKAIDDDPPEIEDDGMYVVSADKTANGPTYPVYIVAKVKDYLLADIEISSMTIDGNPVDLTEFFNAEDSTYKPYYKFGKDKKFLIERPDPNLLDKDDNVITLYPGEFYVQVDLDGNDPHEVNLVMKNPAEKESEPYTFTVQRPIVTDESPTGTISDAQPTIQARIYSPLGIDIDSNSLEMKLDGSPVIHTTSGSSSDMTISYTPSTALDHGQHTVIVNGNDINSLPAEEKQWSFEIRAEPYIDSESPTGTTENRRPWISAIIHASAGVNTSSINFTLDGENVDYTYQYLNGYYEVKVYFSPPDDLEITEHSVTITANDRNGISAEKTWIFNVLPIPALGSYKSAVTSYLGYKAYTYHLYHVRDFVEANPWHPSRPWEDVIWYYKPMVSSNSAGVHYSWNMWKYGPGMQGNYYATMRRGSQYIDLREYTASAVINNASLTFLWKNMIPGDRNGEISGAAIVSYFVRDDLFQAGDSLFDYTGTTLRVLSPPYSDSDSYDDEIVDITDIVRANVGKVIFFMISRQFEQNSNWASGLQASNDPPPIFLDYWHEDLLWRTDDGWPRNHGSLTGRIARYGVYPLFQLYME